MNAVRKNHETMTVGFTYGLNYRAVLAKAPFPAAPEAFAYQDDVTPEAVKQLQNEADKDLAQGEWELVDGFDGFK